MHFSSPFQAKSICLLNKEGSEPVIITHHTLGSMKVTLAIVKPRVCGGCSKHCIIAAASIPTINAKKPRRNGSSPRNCHDLRVKWNPKSLLQTAPPPPNVKTFFFFFLVVSYPNNLSAVFPGSREQTGKWRQTPASSLMGCSAS